jgi:hypothetical protein
MILWIGLSNIKSGSSSAAPAPAATAAVIPTSVTGGCATFLSALDSDPSLQNCLKTINDATGSLTPSSSSSDITTALGSICGDSATSACSDALFRTQATAFLASCQQELSGSNPNKDVQKIYDALYSFVPFRDSVCSTDPTGSNTGYCLTTLGKQAASGSGASLVALAKQYLVTVVQLPFTKRASTGPFSAAGTYLTPNTTTFQAASIPFLFLTPSTPQTTLCSSCAQAVLKPYLEYESSVANALGVTSSPLMGGQKPLWDAVQNTCGTDFTSGVVANAGAAPSTPSGVTVGGSLGAASKSAKISAGGVIAAAVIGAFVAL